MKLKLVCIGLIAGTLWGQADGISVTASRWVSLPPAETIFDVSVYADYKYTLDEVIAKLPETGITPQNLAAIDTAPPVYGPGGPVQQARLRFSFRLPVPSSRVRETAERLERMRRNELEVEINFTAIGSTPGAAALEEARQRLMPDLLNTARARAQELARTSQLTLGRIISVSDTAVLPPPGTPSPLQTVITILVRYSVE
jgi:hypothetical protein